MPSEIGQAGLGIGVGVGDPRARGVDLARAVRGAEAGVEREGERARVKRACDGYEAGCARDLAGVSYAEYLRRQNERDLVGMLRSPVADGSSPSAGERVGFGGVEAAARGGFGLPRLGDIPAAEVRVEVVERVRREVREVMLPTGNIVDVVA